MYYINIKISRRIPVLKSLHAHDIMKITVTAVKQPKNRISRDPDRVRGTFRLHANV